MEPTLYCIASVPSIWVLQSATTAAGFSLAGAGVTGVGAVATEVFGAGSGVVAGAGSAVAAGAGVSDAGGDLPQAAIASVHAATRRAMWVFMTEAPGGNPPAII
jgi:hypothetical protein